MCQWSLSGVGRGIIVIEDEVSTGVTFPEVDPTIITLLLETWPDMDAIVDV